MQRHLFNIAGHTFSIDAEADILAILPSMQPFTTESDTDALFRITIDNTMQPEWDGNRIGTFPCPSATFEVYRQADGAYRILVSYENGTPCAFIQGNAGHKEFTVVTRGTNEEKKFGLNNSIMLIYTLCTATRKTLLVHSSVVENGGKAYMFLGASGRGKSTHSDLWTRHIKGSTLINDDNPVIRISSDGTPIVYGSPWSGKRPIYKNVSYPIGGITAIEQAKENSIRRERIPVAFGIMLASCSTLKFDKEIHMAICGTITNILERIAIHTLFCLPDEAAAQTSSRALGV